MRVRLAIGRRFDASPAEFKKLKVLADDLYNNPKAAASLAPFNRKGNVLLGALIVEVREKKAEEAERARVRDEKKRTAKAKGEAGTKRAVKKKQNVVEHVAEEAKRAVLVRYEDRGGREREMLAYEAGKGKRMKSIGITINQAEFFEAVSKLWHVKTGSLVPEIASRVSEGFVSEFDRYAKGLERVGKLAKLKVKAAVLGAVVAVVIAVSALWGNAIKDAAGEAARSAKEEAKGTAVATLKWAWHKWENSRKEEEKPKPPKPKILFAKFEDDGRRVRAVFRSDVPSKGMMSCHFEDVQIITFDKPEFEERRGGMRVKNKVSREHALDIVKGKEGEEAVCKVRACNEGGCTEAPEKKKEDLKSTPSP